MYDIRATLPETPLRIAEAHDSNSACHVASCFVLGVGVGAVLLIFALMAMPAVCGAARCESLLWRRRLAVTRATWWRCSCSVGCVVSIVVPLVVVENDECEGSWHGNVSGGGREKSVGEKLLSVTSDRVM